MDEDTGDTGTSDMEEDEEGITNAGLDDETPLLGDIFLPPIPTLDQDGDEHSSTEATILAVQGGTSFVLPVGNGITTAIWLRYSDEQKLAVSRHFNCSTIGQFEDEILNLGNGIINSQHENDAMDV